MSLDPKELVELADRIDHEKLWARPWSEREQMTQEQRDRFDAGVALRRFADGRFNVLKALQEGREYLRGYKLTRIDHSTDHRGCGDGDWHSAISQFSDRRHKAGKDWPRMMYTAKTVSDEVPRMILLFENERRGLPQSYKMCAHDPSPATPLPDNHLRCHLGVECRKCEYLAAIDASEKMTNEAKDEAKAWTCATHILLCSDENVYFEGMLRDKSDDAFDQRMLSMYDAEIGHGR